MNLEGTVLKLLLEESNKDKALQIYSELRPSYFSPSFLSIYKLVGSFYDTFSKFPSLQELKVFKSSDVKTVASITTLELLDVSEIDITFALSVLEDQHAQNVALGLIEQVLDKITLSDRLELLEQVSSLPLKLEEEIRKTNQVFTIKDIDIFSPPSVVENKRIISGISDEWDNNYGGYWKQDLILYGGKRGSGKSLVCANLVAQQHLQGLPSLYFTIEMTAEETMRRILGIIAEVPAHSIKTGNYTHDEVEKLAKALANLYEGGEELYTSFTDGKLSPIELQSELRRLPEKDEGRIVVIDDRDLSIGTIDTKIASWKSRYGDKLGLVIIDYLNQVVIDGTTDMYDWKDQIMVSKTLKNLARKYDVCIVSPYQMDEDGKARFSKGILDACDAAQLIQVQDKDSGHIVFENTKMRSGEDGGKCRVTMNWKTLRIDPRAVVLDEITEDSSSNSKKKQKKANSDEAASDLELNV